MNGFDHLVLRCADVDVSLAFYVGTLGLAPVRVEEWRGGQAPFPSVRVSGETIIDLVRADGPVAALDHFCLVAPASVVADLGADRARYGVFEGPVERYGARGMGMSVYLRDPDGHVVEIRTYDQE